MYRPADPPRSKRSFLGLLEEMTPDQRRAAARGGGFSHHERTIWAARFPEEVPLINGEYEWIVLQGVDLD